MATKLKNDPFIRTHNRTVNDVFRNFIKPSLETLAHDMGAKTIHRAKTRHDYQNRTGALESSKRWKVRKLRGGKDFEIDITAGGIGRVQFSRRDSVRATRAKGFTPTGQSRRIPRRGRVASGDANARVRQSERRALKRGDRIVVNYARAVEKRGYSVLKEAVNWARHKLGKSMANFLKTGIARL